MILIAAALLGLGFIGWRVYDESKSGRQTKAELASTRLELGRKLLEAGRLGEADEAFQLASRLSPASYAPRQARIGILGLERRAAEQEQALWFLSQSGPRVEVQVEALCLLARGGPVIPAEALRPGEDEGAALARALQAEPENVHARAALAYYRRNRGMLDEARQLLDPWVREHGDVPPVGDEYVALLLDEGRLDDAGRILDGSGSSGQSTRRSLLRGVWRAMRGQHAEAVDAFQAAIRDDPRDPEPRHRLAQSLRALGRGDAAESARAWVDSAQALRQLVSRLDYAAPDPAALRRASELCHAMGREREAVAWRRLAPGSF
jgi:tetratricopeptide (TPR) repeat protein